MNKNVILTAVGAVVLAVGAYFFIGGNDQTPFAVNAQSADLESVDTSGVMDPTLGDESAPITIVEYASFTCPHCRTFHENAFKQIKKDYIDTGKVKFVFREVYFDRYGLWAGMVARCGGGNRYFGIIDLIFENQSEWTQGDPATIAGNLRRFGKLAGLDDATLDACMTDADKATALNAFYQKNAQADGIRSTPSFVIDGELHSNMSYSDFQALLDSKL